MRAMYKHIPPSWPLMKPPWTTACNAEASTWLRNNNERSRYPQASLQSVRLPKQHAIYTIFVLPSPFQCPVIKSWHHFHVIPKANRIHYLFPQRLQQGGYPWPFAKTHPIWDLSRCRCAFSGRGSTFFSTGSLQGWLCRFLLLLFSRFGFLISR